MGLGFLNQSNANGWPGLEQEVQRLNFLIFGLILISIMLLRPQGLLPSRVRKEELEKGVQDQAVVDVAGTA